MKKTLTTLFVLVFISLISINAQVWQQTVSTPEGGGVTGLVRTESHIFVSTTSFNWPNGDNGGVRRSSDEGVSWDNLIDAYLSRTIELAEDGYLYCSLDTVQGDNRLYRSTDNGDTWILITTMPSGDYIYSISVNTTIDPPTILLGTSLGVYRSLDDGQTWSYANDGLPEYNIVNDICTDTMEGYIALASLYGLYISDDNGENWAQATGEGVDDDIIYNTVEFIYYENNRSDFDIRCSAGANNGALVESLRDSQYLLVTLKALFDEPANLIEYKVYFDQSLYRRLWQAVASFVPPVRNEEGFKYTTDDGATWVSNTEGLPSEYPPIRGLSTTYDSLVGEITANVGLFEYTNGGAKVYTLVIDTELLVGIDESILSTFESKILRQNYPNPASNSTTISYTTQESGELSLKLYATDGHLVKTIASGFHTAGEHEVLINTDELTEGIYYYKIRINGFAETRRLIIAR